MFDLFRNHTKVLMGILVLLIVPSFVLLGMEGYTQFTDRQKSVAVVDGQKIKQSDWDEANRLSAMRLRSQNPDVDPGLFDSPEIRYATLEQMVRERVLFAAARQQHLMTSDARLARYLSDDPTIASLRDKDGKLNMEAYRQLLARQGLTPESFEASIRQQLSSQQVLMGVANSSFPVPAQADLALNAYRQIRNIQFIRFNPEEYASKVDVIPTALNEYYKNNENLFRKPESADIAYVELTLDALKASMTVSEDELKSYYEANKATLGEPEQRRASHILIEAPRDLPEAERAKARAKAEAIHSELLKNPDSFAEVAKHESQDSASASEGGDLGYFTAQNAAVVDDISKAAFALKTKGEISAVIDADFGFDIVQLTDIKPSAVPAYADVRAKLEEQYRSEQAQKRFNDQADEMGKLAFEQRNSLQPIADKFKLPIREAKGLIKGRTQPPGIPAELGHSELISAVFDDDVARNRGNTQPVAVAPDKVIVARVLKHMPEHVEPFDQVKDRVQQLYVAEQSARLAREAAKAQLANASQLSSWSAAVDVSREQYGSVPAPIVEAAMRAPIKPTPHIEVVDLGAQGAAIVRVNRAVAPEPLAADAQKQALDQYAAGWARAEMDAYYAMLKDRLRVKISVPNPAKAGR